MSSFEGDGWLRAGQRPRVEPSGTPAASVGIVFTVNTRQTCH